MLKTTIKLSSLAAQSSTCAYRLHFSLATVMLAKHMGYVLIEVKSLILTVPEGINTSSLSLFSLKYDGFSRISIL